MYDVWILPLYYPHLLLVWSSSWCTLDSLLFISSTYSSKAIAVDMLTNFTQICMPQYHIMHSIKYQEQISTLCSLLQCEAKIHAKYFIHWSTWQLLSHSDSSSLVLYVLSCWKFGNYQIHIIRMVTSEFTSFIIYKVMTIGSNIVRLPNLSNCLIHQNLPTSVSCDLVN